MDIHSFIRFILSYHTFLFFWKRRLIYCSCTRNYSWQLTRWKVSDLEVFGYTFTVSMGAIMYSGIYFATDLLNEKYGRKEATKAVIIGAVANVVVMLTLVLSTFYLPSEISSSADSVHEAISTLAVYSPIFVIGSITAYLISQSFDVWVFHKIKTITGERMLWLRNNVSTLLSQALDTFIYTFVWVIAGELDFITALSISLTKYVFKFFIAIVDTFFIYFVKNIRKNEILVSN